MGEQKKARWFAKPWVEDLPEKELARAFGNFSIPQEGEGFDEVRYEWQVAGPADDYLKAWIKERKLTQRVEDLQPGAWFRDQWNEFNRLLSDWRRRANDWERRPPVEKKGKKEKAKNGVEGEEKEKKEEKDEKEEKEEK